MDAKYEKLTQKSTDDFEDIAKLFKHKNARSVRRKKQWQLLGMIAVTIIILTITLIRQSRKISDSEQQNVFHLLSTRNSAKIYLWDVAGDRVTLLLQNEITLSKDAGNPVSCDSSNFDLCLEWDKEIDSIPGAKITVRRSHINKDFECHKFNISTPVTTKISSCILITGEHIYGGPINKEFQYWPSETHSYSFVPRATGQGSFGGLVESYWLTSRGTVIYVPRDVPLFISQNKSSLCLHSKIAAPYTQKTVSNVNLKYYVCQGDDLRKLYTGTTQFFLGVPSALPDKIMFQHPVWSTWARYKRHINSSLIMDFAEEIVTHGFNRSQLEMDDSWETCYGEFKFNKNKFVDPLKMVHDLHEKGFRITLWIHPFISSLCPSFSEAQKNGYLVSSLNGKINTTVWWNGIAGLVDFTNPRAVSWWNTRLRTIRDAFGIDGFKFDAGETSYMPGSPNVGTLNVPVSLQPNIYTTRYVENAATLSQIEGLAEFRVMYMNQKIPVFLRMNDRNSTWGYDTGLKSLIPTLLTYNMVGYSFVLPDMIGGNGYGAKPSKELFIRWLQACTFMPSLQFSYSPWDYDIETVEISKKFTSLHYEYSEKIIQLAEQKVANGTPINLPIWWLDPTDKTALTVDSEYLLGDSLLVAPILEEGATSRDIYFPEGKWKQKLRNDTYTLIVGPAWVRNYEVRLDELAYFIRIS